MEEAFDRELEHGRAVGVRLPENDQELLRGAERLLDPADLARAQGFAAPRRRGFLGGRVALRLALDRLGAPGCPIPTDDRGAPVLPAGFVGSISHKTEIAVALAAKDDGATRGVDVELDAPLRRPEIARHVLDEEERAAWDLLPEAERPRALLVAFSMKEAIYKAIDPFVRRYVGFKEVRVAPREDGGADVIARLREGPLDLAARWQLVEGAVLTTAIARRPPWR